MVRLPPALSGELSAALAVVGVRRMQTSGKDRDMKNLATKAIVKLHDRKLQHDLRRDEEGLTMLAYALGAAIVIVPSWSSASGPRRSTMPA